MTYQEMLHVGEEQLYQAGIEEYKQDAWILFSFAFNMDRIDFLMNCINWMEETEESEALYQHFLNLIEQRKSHIPVQYITHEQNFYGFDFYVDERVLIPRQDTEVLVECVEQVMGREMLKKGSAFLGRLLDVCTGSGCIAITLANVLQWDSVVAVDVSKAALEVAAKNNSALGSNVKLIHSDLFSSLQDFKRGFDVIVSNPPYIESDVIDTLADEVRCYEPRLALDGSADGLHFYRRIIEEAKEYLTDDGLLFFEIGYNQGAAVRSLFLENGYSEVHINRDLAGLDRVAWARLVKES